MKEKTVDKSVELSLSTIGDADFWKDFGHYMSDLVDSSMWEPKVTIAGHDVDDNWNRRYSVSIEIPDLSFINYGEEHRSAIEMKKRLFNAYQKALQEEELYAQGNEQM